MAHHFILHAQILTCGFSLLLASALTGCLTTDPLQVQPPGSTQYYMPEDRSPPLRALPQNLHCPLVTRRQCILTAISYLEHQWTPTTRNVLHGKDVDGIQVDTPDINFRPAKTFPGWWAPDLVNRGIPYQWGGFSTLEEFDAGIAAGKAAGDICTGEKRSKLDDAVSQHAVGDRLLRLCFPVLAIAALLFHSGVATAL